MSLCTVDDVKALMGRTDNDDDAVIALMVAYVSEAVARELGRFDESTGTTLAEQFANRVERFEGGVDFVNLQGFPLAEDDATGASLVAVREATTIAELDTATDLVLDTDYYIRQGTRVRLCRLSSGVRVGRNFGGWVRVTYSGGWSPADDLAPNPDYVVIPPGLREACAMQADHLFKFRENMEQQSVVVGTATIAKVERWLVPRLAKFLNAQKHVGIG